MLFYNPKVIIIINGFFINMQVQGQHSHQWAPFQVAGLLQSSWQISHQISRIDSQELPLSAIPLCQLLPCHLWSPRPMLSLNLYVKGCLDCTIIAFHMSTPAEPVLSFRMRPRSSMLSHASSYLDLVVTMYCDLTLQICLIIVLSFCCRGWRFGFVSGQVSLAWYFSYFSTKTYVVGTH